MKKFFLPKDCFLKKGQEGNRKLTQPVSPASEAMGKRVPFMEAKESWEISRLAARLGLTMQCIWQILPPSSR